MSISLFLMGKSELKRLGIGVGGKGRLSGMLLWLEHEEVAISGEQP